MIKTWPDTGELVRRVVIRLWQDVPDSNGFGIDQTFSAGITRWAKIEPISGGDFWASKQIGDGVTHRIWVRYATGTRPSDLGGQYVIDYIAQNLRYRVKRVLDVNNAGVMVAIDCTELGAIPA